MGCGVSLLEVTALACVENLGVSYQDAINALSPALLHLSEEAQKGDFLTMPDGRRFVRD